MDAPKPLGEQSVEDEGIGPIPTIAWSAIVPRRRRAATAEDSPLLKSRRRAVRDLGRAIRRVGGASVVTEVDDDELREARELIMRATGILERRSRESGVPAAIDDAYAGIRMYLPMSGEGNPYIEPVHFDLDDHGTARGRVWLDQAFQGPPRHVHGGVSAMLLDQVLGHVVAARGHPALTRELTIRYRRPVPAEEPLWLCGRVLSSDPRTVLAEGWITTVAAPDEHLVTARGEFRKLRPEQVSRFMP